MEEDAPVQPPKPIKGKDLPGAVNVLPAGLGEVLAKRESREFKMEQKGSSMTFSSGDQHQTFSTSSAQEVKAASMKTFSSSSSSATSFSSSQSFMQKSQQQVKSILKQPQVLKPHGEEIEQETLKTKIQSAITDIEQNLDNTDYKENVAPSTLLMQQQEQLLLQQQQMQREQLRQQQLMMQQQQEQEQLRLQQEQLRLQQQQEEQQEMLMMQHEEQMRIEEEMLMQQQQQMLQQQAMEQSARATTNNQNGHFNASDLMRANEEQRAKLLRTPREFKGRPQSITNLDDLYTPQELDLPDPIIGKKVAHQSVQHKESMHQESSMSSLTVNGSHSEETSSSMSRQQMYQDVTVGDGILLSQIMTPVQDPDYDTNSLKRRNPRQMYTDSAFYSPKFHPSVAEQVEMAHKLSSSLYHDGNKMSKGQEMYLKRAKKSGDVIEIEPEFPKHDKTPNLKLVMNPEGKLHDWRDLPEEEMPDMSQIAYVGNPEIAQTLVSNLNSCQGKGGELFAKRRKKADKWVVDENQVGMAPSQFADEFMAQQSMAQKQFLEEKKMEMRAQQLERDEADAQQMAQQQEFQLQQQQIFQEQQLIKQQQSMQIKQEQQMRKQSVDIPPNFQRCNLKGRSFTPSLDLSIHNVQGIDVWAMKGPKPYSPAGTFTSTTPLPVRKQQAPLEASHPKAQVEEACQEELPSLEVVTQQEKTKEEVDFEQMKAQMEVLQQKQATSTKVVSQTSEVSSSVVSQSQAKIEEDLAEKKRKEYEEWLRTQEMEAYRLEYDCSVKYEEHKPKEEVVETVTTTQHQTTTQASQQVTTNFNHEQRSVQQQQQQNHVQEAKPQPARAVTPEPLKPVELPKPVEQPKPIEQPRPKSPSPVPQKQQLQSRDTTDYLNHDSFQQQQQQFSSSSFSSKQKFESHSSSTYARQEQSNLSMQFKSGGVLGESHHRLDHEVEDYVGSLRPTTTGELIRSPIPDPRYTIAHQNEQEKPSFGQAGLKQTIKDPRDSGIFGGIIGEHNSLVEAADYERHTVRHLVEHFSKTKPGDIPPQFLPQQYMQNSANAPPLSYLKEQASTKDFSYKESTVNTSSTTTSTKKTTFSAEENAERLKLFQRRGSLKDYLMMDCEGQQQSHQQSIIDPSAILQVDGSLEPGLAQRRLATRDSMGRECDSQGRLIDTDKWDNHNTIARGWITAGEDHYHPVTFRRIYGAKQVPASPLPSKSPQVMKSSSPPYQPPEEEECADL